jgi:hypothetical protein
VCLPSGKDWVTAALKANISICLMKGMDTYKAFDCWNICYLSEKVSYMLQVLGNRLEQGPVVHPLLKIDLACLDNLHRAIQNPSTAGSKATGIFGFVSVLLALFVKAEALLDIDIPPTDLLNPFPGVQQGSFAVYFEGRWPLRLRIFNLTTCKNF